MAGYRWFILALLFLVTTNNFLDRIVLSVMYPIIRDELHISTEQYGYINAAFQLAYTVGFLALGKFIDRFGTRIGYLTSILWWSAGAALHAAARSALDLGFWRGLLGFGESGNFPAAIKAIAEWFPQKDRALATGLCCAGTNVAAVVGPPVFVWLAAAYGWRACFLITASTGFALALVWWVVYPSPEGSCPVDAPQPRIGWLAALGYKQTWGFGLAKFFTDPVFWFYLYWLPPYLYDVRKFRMLELGWALPVVYLAGDTGCVIGGWSSGFLMRRGWSNGAARKTVMGVCAGLMPVAATAVLAPNATLAIALVSIGSAAHQGWSANLFTTTSDVFPREAVASVTGIGGSLGGLGGVIFSSLLPGYIVAHFGYTPIFMILGCFHLTAFAVVHLLLGHVERVGN